ncbi:MAG: hypothetical protein MUF49_04600 [Oculatellaceae cyanobacterium Prado106]|nr:hypothetical protein [Oculatellaceae cyanobacterium Prado106]
MIKSSARPEGRDVLGNVRTQRQTEGVECGQRAKSADAKRTQDATHPVNSEFLKAGQRD